MRTAEWLPSSWRNFPAMQQPAWPDRTACDAVLNTISQLPALVFAGETRKLKSELAAAVRGEAFVLHCGECSEEFSRCHGPSIHNLLNVILQMTIITTYAGEKRVVNIGRLAGQYAKPRSSETELINGIELPSFRGDMVNSPEPTLKARIPSPERMLEGYFRAASTLNLVRAFTRGGYASIDQVQSWHKDFLGLKPVEEKLVQ